MAQDAPQIVCPHCGNAIDIEDVLAHDVEERLQREYASRLDEERKASATAATAAERARLSAELEALARANTEAQQRLDLANKREVEFLKLQMEFENHQRQMDVLVEQRVLEAKKQTDDTMRRQFDEQLQNLNRNHDEQRERMQREFQKKFDDMQRQADELRRRAEQGSQQLQGEIQELILEEFLRDAFPLDTIEAIGKGQRGGDCIHHVRSRSGSVLGSIYYESKRTKVYGSDWIDKLKSDMRQRGITVGVLATEAMPKDMERFGLMDGVWVCPLSDVKPLAHVLREQVMRLGEMLASQHRRDDKMSMLYDYLTSDVFRQQVESIMQAFLAMKSDLDKERLAMEKLWKQREKQIDIVLKSTTTMFGEISGIAGAAIGPVSVLELPDPDAV